MEHEEFIRSGACTMTTVNGGLCCGGKCAAVRVAISFWRFFTNLSGPSTPGRRFVMDQSWLESCTAWAEPCQLAVWKVKMCPLKGSDVFFVRPLSAHRKEVLCHKGGNFCVIHNRKDTSFFRRHSKPHTELRRHHLQCNTYIIGRALTSKTVQSPRRCSHSRATYTRHDRTGGGSLHFLHVANCKRGGREVRTMRRGG